MSNKTKRFLSLFLCTCIFGGTAVCVNNFIPGGESKEVLAADSDVRYQPIADYAFISGNPGYESNQKYYLTSIGNPTATGSNSSYGTVSLNGASQFMASEINPYDSSSKNNPFYAYPNGSFTICFTIKFTSLPNNWLFPITFFEGGEIYTFAKGHVGFVVNNGTGTRYLMFIDKAYDGVSSSTGWWGDAITTVEANTTYTIVMTINQSGNTKIYLNGNTSPVYNKATNFKNYACSGCDWSVFSLGGVPNTQGSWQLQRDGSGNYTGTGVGFAPVVFQYLKIYNFEASADVCSQFNTRHYLPKKYTITYNANGGTDISAGSYYASINDYTYNLSTSSTRDGYSISSYTITTNTSGASCTVSGTTLTVKANAYGNITVRANWIATSYSISYTLNGGSITGGGY